MCIPLSALVERERERENTERDHGMWPRLFCENNNIEWAQAQVLQILQILQANGQPLDWAQWQRISEPAATIQIIWENCQAKTQANCWKIQLQFFFAEPYPGGNQGAWETQVECGNVADRCILYILPGYLIAIAQKTQTQLSDPIHSYHSLNRIARQIYIIYIHILPHKKYLSMSRTLFAN